MEKNVIHKIGRRKTSVARIYLKKGKGNILINSKDWKSYFPSPSHQFKVNQPFNVCGLDNSFDMSVNVYGGGMTGQVRLSDWQFQEHFVKLMRITEKCSNHLDFLQETQNGRKKEIWSKES